MRKILTFFMISSFLLTILVIPNAQANNESIDYLALGDSIAAGQTPYGVKVGWGFTDMISQTLQQNGMLATFDKKYAVSGQTTEELVSTIERADVKQSIKDAELVTITSGANDFINGLFDSTKNEVIVDKNKAYLILNAVSSNLTKSIKTIKQLNQDAEIYLFGYYFPIPHYDNTESKQLFKEAFEVLNEQLRFIANEENISFVDIASVFDENGSLYLENTNDIHPNEAGYKVIADEFFKKYSLLLNVTFPDTKFDWGKRLNEITPVSPNKKWVVTTNIPIKPLSINTSLYIVKDGIHLINVSTKISLDEKSIIITPPIQGYKPGSYEIMITNDLSSKSDKKLNTSVIKTFTVE